MKFVSLCLLFLLSMGAFAECADVNLFEKKPQFIEYFLPKEQNFGTCYAETAAFTYNFNSVMLSKSTKSLVHPLILMGRASAFKYSIDGGSYDDWTLDDREKEYCSRDSIDSFLLNFYEELIGYRTEPNIAENVFIKFSQIIFLIEHQNIKEAGDWVMGLRDKNEFEIYHPYLSDFWEQYQIYMQHNVEQDVLKNTIVLDVKIGPKPKEIQFWKNISFIREYFYTSVSGLDSNPKRESLELFLQVLLEKKYSTFGEFLIQVLDKACLPQEKIKGIVNHYAEQINNQLIMEGTKAKAHHLLKAGLASLLPVSSSMIDEASKGSHSVVLMGMQTEGDRCQYLIRNSWDVNTDYKNAVHCHCYDRSLKMQIPNCSRDDAHRKNYEILGCWYSEQEVLLHAAPPVAF